MRSLGKCSDVLTDTPVFSFLYGFKFGFVEELVAPLSLIFVGHPERAAGESKDLGRRPLDGGRF